MYDRQWSAVPSGMNILANIAPQGPIDKGYCKANSYLPVDEQKYIAFVKAVVDRYNGDGINDMPGLTSPIKYWQVGNEPSTRKSGFAELQRITYAAIKEVCPDCTVLIGGVPGMPPVSGYIANFDEFYKPILDALAGQYVDVMDFHWYGNATGDYLGAKDAYDHIRTVLDADGFQQIPFWIAEMGAYSGNPVPVPISNPPIDYPLQTERQQALDYFKRFIYPLSFGVKKIFPAFGLMEGFKYDGGYFDLTGLIYDGWDPAGAMPYDLGLGVKKLGYYTYKKMTEMLEGADWGGIQTVRESDNVRIYRLTKNGHPVYVAWWDYFNDPSSAGDTKQIVLDGLEVNSPIMITEVVPDSDKGQDVTDYNTAFSSTIAQVVSGQATINLGDSPVVITASDSYSRVTLLTPNGGESLASGSTYRITWGAPAAATKFNLHYSVNGGKTWKAIVSNVTGTAYDWTVPPQKANRKASLVKVTGFDSGGSQVGLRPVQMRPSPSKCLNSLLQTAVSHGTQGRYSRSHGPPMRPQNLYQR